MPVATFSKAGEFAVADDDFFDPGVELDAERVATDELGLGDEHVFGGSQDNLVLVPITRFFENYGHANRTVNIATQAVSQALYTKTYNIAVGAMRIAQASERPRR